MDVSQLGMRKKSLRVAIEVSRGGQTSQTVVPNMQVEVVRLRLSGDWSAGSWDLSGAVATGTVERHVEQWQVVAAWD